MKKSIVVMTLVSAVLFCSVFVLSSLSPIAESGPAANEFNSLGLWIDIGIFLVLYIVPLILYAVGVKAVKYIMAVFCGLGLLITLSMAAGVFVVGKASGDISSLSGVIIVSIATLLANIIWFVVAFRKTPTPTLREA